MFYFYKTYCNSWLLYASSLKGQALKKLTLSNETSYRRLTEIKTSMSIEAQQYKLIKKEANFEIRSYDEMVVARTSVNSDY